MTKILFLSDAHLPYQHNPVTKHLKNKDAVINDDFINTVGKTKQGFLRHLEKARKNGPYDCILCLGDMIHGYKEQGLNNNACLKGINELKNIISYYFPNAKVKFIAGGHELGYIFPLSKDPNGGLNEKSVNVFESNFNELFFSYDLKDIRIIGLSSDLEFYEGKSEKLLQRKKSQRDFLADILGKSNMKVILLIHDPEALTFLDNILDKFANKIHKTYSGHYHANWIKYGFHVLNALSNIKIMKKLLIWLGNKYAHKKGIDIWQHFHNKKSLRKVEKKYKLQIVPAPNGMKGFGSNLIILDLTENS